MRDLKRSSRDGRGSVVFKKCVTLILAFVFACSILCGCGGTSGGAESKAPDVSGVTFTDKAVDYDGNTHTIAAENLPVGVTAEYENNAHKNAGEYDAQAKLYHGKTLLKTLDAKLTVRKKAATVTIDDKTSVLGDAAEQLTYTVSGVIDGDDLGVKLTVDTNSVGEKQITGSYTNTNYAVTFNGGKYTVTSPDVSGVVFEDKTVVYNGKPQTITATNLPSGVRATYTGNAQIDAGTYTATTYLYKGSALIDTLTAKLIIQKKPVTVIIDDKAVDEGASAGLTYTANDVIDGDDLGVTLTVDTSASGVKTITGKATNTNYDVTFVDGTCTVQEKIMDNLSVTTDNFIADLAPFALKDAIFSNFVITSVSFVYGGLVNGYTSSSNGLTMPIYVVKSDFSTPQADCTVENGKKIILDFTGKLGNKKAGDTVTADNLNIVVGEDETLAFGDSTMKVLPKYRKGDTSYGFSGKIFANKENYYQNSLAFTIKGYPTDMPDLSGVVFEDKTDETDGLAAVSITASNIPNGVTVRYENNTHTTAGVYTAKAKLYRGLKLVKTFTAQFTVKQCLMNNLADANVTVKFSPNYAPFALLSNIFAGKTITSISFMFAGYGNGANESSANLNMPLYIVKSDFSTKQADCTVENGKKIILDFTGKMSNVNVGDILTVDDLEISVGEDETLVFGDGAMTILPAYTLSKTTYPFKGKIFEANPPQWTDRSLTFKIVARPDDTVIEGKYISFLGDSISTYAGYSNNVDYNATIGNNAIWFPNNNYAGANMAVTETWWNRTTTMLGYTLCVNNSWSGSVVKDAQTYNVRAKNLHDKNGNTPDVIVVFMGVNDYAANTSVGTYDGTVAPDSPSDFSGAYTKTVKTIKANYPDAHVFCCTFLPDRKRFSGGSNGSGISETAYNAAIRTIAGNNDCTVIDLYANSGITADNIGTYTVDRLHPNSAGMSMIANTVVSAVRSGVAA